MEGELRSSLELYHWQVTWTSPLKTPEVSWLFSRDHRHRCRKRKANSWNILFRIHRLGPSIGLQACALAHFSNFKLLLGCHLPPTRAPYLVTRNSIGRLTVGMNWQTLLSPLALWFRENPHSPPSSQFVITSKFIMYTLQVRHKLPLGSPLRFASSRLHRSVFSFTFLD
jgi:hypothetical protein